MRQTRTTLDRLVKYLNQEHGYPLDFGPCKGKYIIDHNSTGYRLCRYTNDTSFAETEISARVQTLKEICNIVQAIRFDRFFNRDKLF